MGQSKFNEINIADHCKKGDGSNRWTKMAVRRNVHRVCTSRIEKTKKRAKHHEKIRRSSHERTSNKNIYIYINDKSLQSKQNI